MESYRLTANQDLLTELANIREREQFFRQLVEQLPFPVEVFAEDGTAVMVNKALLEISGIPSADMIVGRYNILKDPAVEERGVMDYVIRAYKGQTVHFTDIQVPLKQIENVYGVKEEDVISAFQDIVIFPVWDQTGKTGHVAVLIKDQRSYNVTKNINYSIRFIQENLQNEFSMEEAAKVANLSTYHFIRVFKSQTGKTPYEFFMDAKMQKAKEMLKDHTKAITEICSSLGFSSSSHFARVFKKATGLAPSEYRKMHIVEE